MDTPHFHEADDGVVPLTVRVPLTLLDQIDSKDRAAVLVEAQAAAESEASLVVAVKVLDTQFAEIALKVPDALAGLQVLGMAGGFDHVYIMNALALLYGGGLPDEVVCPPGETVGPLEEDVRLGAIRTGAGRSVLIRMLAGQLSYVGSPESRLLAIQGHIDSDPGELKSYEMVVLQAIRGLMLAYNTSISQYPRPRAYHPGDQPKSCGIPVFERVVTEADFINLMDRLGHLVALATLPSEDRSKLYGSRFSAIPLS